MEQEAKEFLNNYKVFVDQLTALPSKDTQELIKRLLELEAAGAQPARLLTAAAGLAGESGEFNDGIKKMVFHGKPYNFDIVKHLRLELGDIMWYCMQACLALELDPVQLIKDNVMKLESRYPGGRFDVFHSQNRADGDI